ncbi:MAG: hypothetical protein ACUVRM_10700 [Bacillota bacterium]
MAKKLLVLLAAGVFFLLGATAALAEEPAPQMFLHLYEVEEAKAVGLQTRLAENLYGTLNIEYHEAANDLELRAGVAYLLPYRVLFFSFYGGVGLEFSRNEGYRYPYLALGTNFLFLFSEVVYPLEKEERPKYRSGLSFKF